MTEFQIHRRAELRTMQQAAREDRCYFTEDGRCSTHSADEPVYCTDLEVTA